MCYEANIKRNLQKKQTQNNNTIFAHILRRDYFSAAVMHKCTHNVFLLLLMYYYAPRHF